MQACIGHGIEFSAMKPERSNYRVIKTLAPTDRGAIDLARSYGDALVCVRHRSDAKGKVRHVTVELLVRSSPIRPRSTRMVWLRIQPHERTVLSMVKIVGADRKLSHF
jgi:hypothetical protein